MSRIDTAIYHVDRFTVAAKENQSFEAAVAAFKRERQAVIESRNLSLRFLLTACAQSATSDVGGGAEGLDFAQCHNRHINELLDQRAVLEQRTREPGVPSSFYERIESICSERIEADDTWSGNWRDPEVWSLSLGAIRDRDLTAGGITALELHRKTSRAVVVACRDIVARDRFPYARHRFEVEFSRRPSHLQPLSRTICMILFDAEWRDPLARVTPESLAYWQIVRDLLYDKTISRQSRDVESGPASAWDLEMYRQIYHTTAPLLWQSRIAAGTKQHVNDFATGALQAIERQYDALAPISAQLELFACGPGPVKVPGRSKDVGKDVVAALQTRKQSPYAGDEE